MLNGPIKVNVVGRSDDNSDYSPVTKALRFGTGGVDDAEDAEIILHEYGHAIQDNQVPGFGASNECGAMGEGFGDYLAGSFFANASRPDCSRALAPGMPSPTAATTRRRCVAWTATRSILVMCMARSMTTARSGRPVSGRSGSRWVGPWPTS